MTNVSYKRCYNIDPEWMSGSYQSGTFSVPWDIRDNWWIRDQLKTNFLGTYWAYTKPLCKHQHKIYTSNHLCILSFSVTLRLLAQWIRIALPSNTCMWVTETSGFIAHKITHIAIITTFNSATWLKKFPFTELNTYFCVF